MKVSIKYIVPIVVVVAVVTTFINALAAPPFVDSGEAEHPECQYSFRPLKDGQCDNSDPAGVPSETPQSLPVYLPVEPPEQEANTCK